MPAMPTSASRHIAEKVDKLAEHALDFFAEKELLSDMHKEPAEAVAQLLRALDGAKHGYHLKLLRRVCQELPEPCRKTVAAVVIEHALDRAPQNLAARSAALELLADVFRGLDHDGLAFLRVAQDATEPQAVRCRSMRALRSARLGKSTGAGLIRMMETPNAPPDLLAATADVIEFHEQAIDRNSMRDALMQAVFSLDGEIRRRMIKLLGFFGHVDTVEIVCSLPAPEPADIAAVNDMVQRVLSRPRNLLAISAKSFEYVTKLLLTKMGYTEIRVTGRPHDGGIDLAACGPVPGGFHAGDGRWIVQCKRWSDPIGPKQIEEFLQKLRQESPASGLFVTTSRFTKEAMALTQGMRVQLVAGPEVVAKLDEYVKLGAYTLSP